METEAVNGKIRREVYSAHDENLNIFSGMKVDLYVSFEAKGTLGQN